MAGVSVVGKDSAGGALTGPGATGWSLNGNTISLNGDGIAPHGRSPHDSASVTSGSSWFTIDGIQVTTDASTTSCGHSVTSDGFMDVPM